MADNVRKNGKYGVIMIPRDRGIRVVDVELAKVATKTIQGIAYANQVYAAASPKMINKEAEHEIRIQGFTGSVSAQPGAADKISVADDPLYYADSSSGIQTGTANTAIACVRPAAGKVCWGLIVMNLDTGVLSCVKGKDKTGAKADLVESFSDPISGTDGALPYAEADELIVCAVKMDETSAVFDSSDIVYNLSNGTLLQERSDVPGFTVLPIEGGVIVHSALLASRAAAATRKIYATFYDLRPSLAALVHTLKWSLAITNATTTYPAQGDFGTPRQRSGPPEWSGSFERYRVDALLHEMGVNVGYAVLRLYFDESDSGYYEGAAHLSGLSTGADQSAANKDTVSFQGDMNIEWRTS